MTSTQILRFRYDQQFARAGAGDRKLTRRAKLCRTHLAALCCTDPHRKFQGKSASRCRIATNPSQDLLGRLVSVEEDSTPTNTADNPQVDTEYVRSNGFRNHDSL